MYVRELSIDEVVQQSPYEHDIYGSFYELACSHIAVVQDHEKVAL